MQIVPYVQLRERGIIFSRVHLRRLIAAGVFPTPIRVSERRIAWIAAEVDAFLERRADERSGTSPRRSTSEAARADRAA